MRLLSHEYLQGHFCQKEQSIVLPVAMKMPHLQCHVSIFLLARTGNTCLRITLRAIEDVSMRSSVYYETCEDIIARHMSLLSSISGLKHGSVSLHHGIHCFASVYRHVSKNRIFFSCGFHGYYHKCFPTIEMDF